MFILGSGFSRSLGLPTLRELFSELLQTPERPGTDDRRETLAALDVLYPHFHSDTPGSSYPPFEEFLSLVVAAKRFSFFDSEYWPRKEISALRLLCDCLGAKSRQAESRPLLGKFVSQLDDGDVVITFNWDTLIERALLAQNRSVNLTGRDASAVCLLKLHGSLSWFLRPEGPVGQPPESVFQLGGNLYCLTDYAYYDLWGLGQGPPFIVPPIFSKEPLLDDFMVELWQEAFDSLIEAQRLTIIGYSLPPDDVQARALISSGCSWKHRHSQQPRYVVVDPDSAVGSRFFLNISRNVTFVQAFLNEEVLSYAATRADR